MDTQNRSNSTPEITCPKCGCRQPYAEECQSCGVFIQKYIQSISKKVNEEYKAPPPLETRPFKTFIREEVIAYIQTQYNWNTVFILIVFLIIASLFIPFTMIIYRGDKELTYYQEVDPTFSNGHTKWAIILANTGKTNLGDIRVVFKNIWYPFKGKTEEYYIQHCYTSVFSRLDYLFDKDRDLRKTKVEYNCAEDRWIEVKNNVRGPMDPCSKNSNANQIDTRTFRIDYLPIGAKVEIGYFHYIEGWGMKSFNHHCRQVATEVQADAKIEQANPSTVYLFRNLMQLFL